MSDFILFGQNISGQENLHNFIALPPGQQLSSASFPTVLSTEQQAILTSIQSNQTNGSQKIQIIPGNTPITNSILISSVTQNVAFSIIATDANRRGLILTNLSNKTLLIRVGANPSSTLYTYSLATNGVLEIPTQLCSLSLAGIYTAAGAATGSLVITGSTI